MTNFMKDKENITESEEQPKFTKGGTQQKQIKL